MIHTSSLTRTVHFSEVNVQLYASGHNYWAESLFEVVYFGECVVVTHMQTQTSGSRRRSSKMNADIYEVKGLSRLRNRSILFFQNPATI